jgi:hypothetical protein
MPIGRIFVGRANQMPESVRHGLLAAYRKLLEPLVRVLIRNGVSHGEVNELLKAVFVDVADRDFALPARKTSQSRVAILTGLSRKEVARQKAILDEGSELDQGSNLNRVIRVLEGWHTDAEFTGPYGLPIEVPFESQTGPNFCELVRRYSGDMVPRAMLDELVRVGAVDLLTTGMLRVVTRAYIPETLHPDALERFGDVIHNFIRTLEYNMLKAAPGAGRFERIVFADDGLPIEQMPEFDRALREKGQQLLVELDNWLVAQEEARATKDRSGERIKTGVGIYHFTVDEDADTS